MVFGLSITEVVFIGVASLFIFGPERLPQVVAKVVRAGRDVQAMVKRARSELHDAVSPELADLTQELRELESAVATVDTEATEAAEVAEVWRGRRRVELLASPEIGGVADEG